MRHTVSAAARHLAIIDPTTDARWPGFVHAHPLSTTFHTDAWARVLIDTYGYEPRYHVIEDHDGAIIAAWPLMLVSSRLTGRRLVSLPFSDHCQPLVRTEAEAARLLDAVIADREQCGARHVELRGWPGAIAVSGRVTALPLFNLYTVELDPDPATVSRGLRKATRHDIRQATEKGVTVRFADGRADLKRFYALNVMTRRRHGVLPQPFAFFEAIDRYLIQPGNAHLLFSQVATEPVAATLVFTYKDTVIDKYGPSDPVCWSYRANHLLQWKIIEWACLHGFRHYDLGRCAPADTGLAFFKMNWGAVRTALPYVYFPTVGGFSTAHATGLKERTLARFAQVAPRPLFVTAGKCLYRHLG